MEMSFDIAKAGWMHRQSYSGHAPTSQLASVLKSWKRAWFVLYTDGMLRYFDGSNQHKADDAVRLQTDCNCIKGGPHVKDVTPPSGRDAKSMLEIELRDKKWRLCAESEDDAKAWYIALEDARLISHNQPPPAAPPVYSTTVYPQQQVAYTYPGQYMYGSQPPAVLYPGMAGHTTHQTVTTSPDGQTTIIVDNTGRCNHGNGCYHGGGDFLMGAAVGSMMMYPYMWW